MRRLERPVWDRGRRRRRGASARVGAASAAALLLLALGTASCADAEGRDPPPPLPGSAASPKALGREVLAALAAADTARLDRVRLTEHEHNDRVWPELPAGRPGSGFPVDFAWTNIQLRNREAVRRLLRRHAGRHLRLEGVECVGETREFRSFVVRTDCWTSFHRDGAPLREQLFKDILVWEGRHKIFRYYAE